MVVNTREIAEEYRLGHWAQVLQERVQSGLTIKAYCKQQGICGNTYFYWQRRVRAAAASELGVSASGTPTQPQVSFREVSAVEQSWYPTDRTASQADQLRIDVNGIHLTVDSTYPVEQLARLLQALSRLC